MNFRVPGPVSYSARANVKLFCQIQVNERALKVSFLFCLRDGDILQLSMKYLSIVEQDLCALIDSRNALIDSSTEADS